MFRKLLMPSGMRRIGPASTNFVNTGILMAVLLVLTSCGGSSSSSSDDDGDDRENNLPPTLQLNDGDVLGGGSSVIRIPAGDDTGIARVAGTIIRQGNLSECSAVIADASLTANSLLDACLLDQPACAVTFQPVGDQIEVIPPPLFAPIGLEYDLTLLDRDGITTEPVRAVFCFDVGINVPPVTTPDVFQLTYPSRISRDGVRYGSRCEKADASQGVLTNDEDDEHVTNTCLSAELLELPAFASNLSTFRSTFGDDGSFVYEAFGELPPENSDGLSIDTFTYRVTDGVNPVSDPVVVEIVFTDSENAAPQAVDDSFTVNEDSDVVQLPVLDNDFDPDALPLSVVGISNGPGSGVATIRNGRLIEYRPQAGFVGQDNFTYTVADSGGLTVTANVTVDIININDAPVAQNDSVSTNENTSVVVSVLSNDTDIESDTLRVTSVTNPRNGSATLAANGTVVYTPDAGYFGPDAFEYTITDGVDTDTATVVVSVVFVNVSPVITADRISVPEGGSVVVDLLANDSDGDNDTLRIVSISEASNGVVVLLEDGNIRYTPNAGFSGTDSFSYRVSDGTIEVRGEVSIVVDLVNDVPVASNDTASTPENTAVIVDVLSNDTDADGDELSVTGVTNVRFGSATVNANNTVTYVPQAGFSGQASFSYTIDDDNGGTDSALVTILVSDTNESPVAGNDVRSTEEDDPVLIQVLNNDSDPDGDDLTVSQVTQPSNGRVTITSSGDAVVYTPASGFSGTDSFTYQVSDGNDGVSNATVTVTVSSVNAVPVAASDTARVLQGGSVNVVVLANDADPDGDTLTVSINSAPENGRVNVLANNTITYTPDATFAGRDSFVYLVADGNGASATATVIVTVEQVIINSSPVASDDDVRTAQGSAVTINALANDRDTDGDSLTVMITTSPENGVASVLADNRIRYTPSAGFVGTDSIRYAVSDGNGGLDAATVTIVVESSNTAPVAVRDTATTAQGQTVAIEVTANDSDADGDALEIASVSAATNGTTSIAGGVIRYTPASGFSGTDSFNYVLSDGNGGEDTATVIVTVTTVNTPPVALADSASTPEATPVNIAVLSNDTDADADPLTVSIATAPASGTAIVTAGNSINYTPTAGFVGTDSLVYVIDDGSSTATATVVITVTEVEVPIDTTPVEPTEPAEEVPIDTTPVEPTEPADETPIDTTPVEPTEPADETPIDTTPVEPTEPADETPIDTTPVEPTEPADETPIDTTPVEPAVPEEEAPVDTTPVETTEQEGEAPIETTTEDITETEA